MWSLWEVALVKGFCVGIEYEDLDGTEYLIVSLLFIQFIFSTNA